MVVERHGEIRHLNEYNNAKARLEFKSEKFATKNISVSVSAPLSVAGRLQNFRCFVIRRTSVFEVHPQVSIEGDRRVWSIYVASLSQETLRLQWSVTSENVSASTAFVLQPTVVVSSQNLARVDNLFQAAVLRWRSIARR